jgi:hypothetical protein
MQDSMILQQIQGINWETNFSDITQTQVVQALENGKIILFPELAFHLLPAETQFLSPHYAHPKAKNISFNSHTLALRCGECPELEKLALARMLTRFSDQADHFMRRLFPAYGNALQKGRTSLRVVEIAGRVSSYRKDDTRLHVDAFPATPNQGKRILRIFTNINPVGLPRVWRVGETFAAVVEKFLPKVARQLPLKAFLMHKLKLTKSLRTHYDHIMLQIHNRMKADLDYQKNASQTEIRFAPNTTWIVQTDQVSHAAMSGQHVLEQTFYLPVQAMVTPTLSPLQTLERMTGRQLA